MADSSEERLILYSCDDFVIADKDHGIPTVPLKGQSPEGTLLGLVAKQFPDIMDVAGRNLWEHGAVHRLDTATAGLVVFARNQRMYDHIMDVQAQGLFSKTYIANTEKDDRLKGLEANFDKDGIALIQSYFRAYGPGRKQVRPTLDAKKADSEVLYRTTVQRLTDSEYRCTIKRGFRHQIRSHLAWIGCPIEGDNLYGNGRDGQVLKLRCTGLSFPLLDGSPFFFGS